MFNHLHVIVLSSGQQTYLPITMKYSRSKFYANTTLSSRFMMQTLYINVFR